MKLGVIGSSGVVGNALVKTLEFVEHTVLRNDVTDIFSADVEQLKKECEIIFLCLPTPMADDGSVDLSILETVLETLRGYEGVTVVKSTVVPGTCARFAEQYGLTIVHNPEFLTAKNADLDSINFQKLVVGCELDDMEAGKKVIKVFEPYEPIGYKLFFTDLRTAEMCKYASNIMLALKVSFANELFDVCGKVDAVYDDVSESLKVDNRVGDYGFVITPERGWGGMCFPKDLSAFRAHCAEHGIRFDFLDTTWEVNERVRKNGTNNN